MGNNNQNNKKEAEDKVEIKDEIKVTTNNESGLTTNNGTASIIDETKKPNVVAVSNTATPTQTVVNPKPIYNNNNTKNNGGTNNMGSTVNNKNEEIKKQISNLEESIKGYNARIARSLNSLDKALYADKVMEANKEINRLKGELNAKPPVGADCPDAPTISNKKPAPESWSVIL